jgi:hypothetical protein
MPTDLKLAELKQIATPFVKWLNENFHPHTEIRITDDSVQILEVQLSCPFNRKFIKD